MPPNTSPSSPLYGPLQIAVQTIGAAPKAFSYRLDEGMAVPRGAIVEVPLGKGKSLGIVLGVASEKIHESKLKSLGQVIDAPALQPALIHFIEWVADYTLTPTGNIVAMSLGGQNLLAPPKRAQKNKIETGQDHLLPTQTGDAPTLNPAQEEAAAKLRASVKQQKFSVTVLDGVTGSGKTEVYCEAIAAAHAQGKQALLMLPEIALTAQLHQRLAARFGAPPALWHSGLTPAQRKRFWMDVANGKSKLVIGARSALFLPYQSLGIIIVDEEHDTSYKQEEGVIYHARDMAVVRGKMEDIPVVLCSATPSLETVVNVQAGRFKLLHLPERHADAVLPNISLIDVREEKLPPRSWISPTLHKNITAALERGEQTLLFLNRRGYAPLTLCRACGQRLSCPQCTAWMVEHRQNGKHRLICHHCDFSAPYPPACPSCKVEGKLAACGPGIERLEEEVAKLFPHARRATLASDTTGNMQVLHQIVEDMAQGRIDILIGTQIVAKGYHFPRLSLVGVIDGDLGLQGGDLRAAERTFQLLYQVAGRSGRAEAEGHVFIQTTQPNHAVMQDLVRHDRDRLMTTLIDERKKFSMPPFARLASITLSGAMLKNVHAAAQILAQTIPHANGFQVLGPAPAPFALLRGKHRVRFLVTAKRELKIQDFLRQWLANSKISKTVRIHVDVDPQSFI